MSDIKMLLLTVFIYMLGVVSAAEEDRSASLCYVPNCQCNPNGEKPDLIDVVCQCEEGGSQVRIRAFTEQSFCLRKS